MVGAVHTASKTTCRELFRSDELPAGRYLYGGLTH